MFDLFYDFLFYLYYIGYDYSLRQLKTGFFSLFYNLFFRREIL